MAEPSGSLLRVQLEILSSRPTLDLRGVGILGDKTLGAVLFFTGLDPQRSPVWRYSLDKKCPLSSYLNGTFPNISLGIFFFK